MHSRTLAPWVLTAIALWLPYADAFSACDDLDIVFMIDTEAFADPFDTVDWTDIVLSVIEDGSSEDDGFSVVLYGDNIPNGLNAVVISFNETQPVHSRAREVELIKAEVTAAYDAVETCRLSGTSDDCTSVSLMDAFELATSQPKPEREHFKADALSGEGYVIDQDDDATRFIFVDYPNELIPESGVASEGSLLCQLLEYETNHEGETMGFLLGQTFDADSLEVDCGADVDVPEDLLTRRMFDVSAVVEERGEEMLLEMVYSWTCPSWVVTETDGTINLGNHDQWMDIDSIIECNLVNAYEDDVTHAIELTNDSYVKVKDIEDSLNTFKVNDFLLEYPSIRDELEERGCWLPVLKILAKVELTDEVCDEADCTILQLTVQVPESPNDYINEANVTTNSTHTTTQAPNSGRRAQNVRFDDDAVDAMRRQLISGSKGLNLINEHWKYDYNASYEQGWEREYEPKALSSYSAPKFTFTGSGALTVSAGIEVAVVVDAWIYYEWSFWTWHTKLYASVKADWSLKAYFGLELTGEMELEVTDILKYKWGSLYWIGIVPIWIDIYATVGAKLTMVPIRLYAGVECSFGEWREWGVDYDSWAESSDDRFFSNRVAKENGCTPKLEIGSEDENAEECPVAELGFDVELSTQIGAILYWALAEAYVRPALVVPFRITMPEMRESVCAGAESSCDDVLMASFNIAMYLKIYLGGNIVGWGGETQVGGDITLIEPTSLGCTTLDGDLSFLDDFYRWSGCCAEDAASPLLLPSPSFTDKKNPSVTVFDLSYVSSHWVGGLLVLLVALLLLNLCRFVVWPRRRTAKYVHVAADCDSEDFTDNNEAKPINVDLAV